MKKLILTILILSLFPQTTLAQNQTISSCKFPTTNKTVKITGTNTTIDYTHCMALTTGTSKADCSTAIKKSKEYTDGNDKVKQAAETTIKKCEVEFDEIQTLKNTRQLTLNKLRETISTNANCITNDGNLKTTSNNQDPRIQVTCNLSENPSEGLKTLQNVFTNQFIFQLIEPITDENLVIQRRTCSYEFLRNKDGLIQAVDPEANKIETRDSNFYKNNLFTITENACFITYVDECSPNLVLDARIKIDQALPISTYCKTYQVISGSSGTDFIKGFVNIIYRLAVGIIGVIAVIVMVVSGIRISTAGDDSGAVTEAKERIAQSIFGLAILFLAWIILRSVNPNFFTTTDLQITDPRNPSQTTTNQTNTDNTSTNAN